MLRITTVISLVLLLGTLMVPVSPLRAQQREVPIKNITRIDGVRENQLRGFGIVVGLDGTGDGDINFVNRSIANSLARLGINIQDPGDVSLENIAAVMVTAQLPPFKRPGDQIDVTISSLGSAEDLTGGVLVQTPLRAGDGNVYAVGQGSVTSGGDVENRHLTTVRIPDGGLVEREVPFEFVERENRIHLQLTEGDFTTATRIARTVNDNFQRELARAKNSDRVQIQIPSNFHDNPVEFISLVENMNVSPAEQSRIVINERTGTVIMGGDVPVQSISISHQDLSIQVNENGGEAAQQQETVSLPQQTTVRQVVNSLNSVGASTDSIIAILEAMDKAGSLNVPLEVM